MWVWLWLCVCCWGGLTPPWVTRRLCAKAGCRPCCQNCPLLQPCQQCRGVCVCARVCACHCFCRRMHRPCPRGKSLTARACPASPCSPCAAPPSSPAACKSTAACPSACSLSQQTQSTHTRMHPSLPVCVRGHPQHAHMGTPACLHA